MLKSPLKTDLRQVPATHVDLFVENYDLLKQWAMRFTEHDHELAEDLLHDAFIQFTLSKPDLESIQNLEGYLFIVMRNLHLSQMRRATRTPLRALSVVEFDTVDVSFWASDPRDRMRMRDELGAVCQYACIRKESAKAGSVLILRFFHGYYPEEIAQVVRTNRSAVEKRLQMARAEVKLYLEEPDRLRFIGDKPVPKEKLAIDHFGEDLRLELRKQIFRSCQGECMSENFLRGLYITEQTDGIDHRTVAHIVSCQLCLESVNSLLDLPPLASRYPLDTIGKDPGKKGGPGDGGGDANTGGGTPGGGPNMLDTFISRRNALFHHQPQELCVSVNGQLQGFQKVVAGTGELTLIIDTPEQLGFIEVFSEQGLRLLMLNVEPPPAGDGKQSARIELSDGRTIDANLNFSGPHPALQVSYNDPILAHEEVVAEIAESPARVTVPFETAATPPQGGDRSAAPLLEERASASDVISSRGSKVQAGSLRKLLSGWRSLFQPVRLTAAFAALLIASLILFKFVPTGTVSAAELLNRSVANEAAQLANKDRVLHRTLDLEEYKNGQLTLRRKIDVWHSAELGVTARRLYDEQGRLTTGDWRSASGIQTIYQKGTPAKLQPSPEKRGAAVLFEDAWQLSLSAKEFASLIASSDDAELEERANDYLISYTPRSQPGAVATGFSNGLTKASITLSKEDLHAIEQSFTLKIGDETREYRMTETAYEWRPANSVAPAVFEPNAELTGGALNSPSSKRGADAVSGDGAVVPDTNTNNNSNTAAPSATLATAALEVDVVEALANANAFMGEPIEVTRGADGKVSVSGLVETDARKRELLGALAGFRSNPAVRIKIETVAEAEERVRRQKAASNSSVASVDHVQVDENENPVFADLKKRFSEDEARRFSSRMTAKAQQVWLHAAAIKQLSQRFSKADLASLSPAERGRWLGLIRRHADSYIREAESLRRELGQIYPEAAGAGGSAGSIGSDAELQASVRELNEASVTLLHGIENSFSRSTANSRAAPVKTAAFWNSYSRALGLARSIAAAR